MDLKTRFWRPRPSNPKSTLIHFRHGGSGNWRPLIKRFKAFLKVRRIHFKSLSKKFTIPCYFSAICLWQKSRRVSTVQLQHPSLAARSKARNRKSLSEMKKGIFLKSSPEFFFETSSWSRSEDSSHQTFSKSQHGTFFHLKFLTAQCDLDSRYC